MSSSKVRGEKFGNVVILRASGILHIGKGDIALRDEFERWLEAGERNFLLDLEHVKFADSAVFGEIVSMYKRAREKNGIVKLLRPSSKVLDVLNLTKLEEIYDIFKNKAEALSSF